MTNNEMKQPEKIKLSKVKLFISIGIILFWVILFIVLHFASHKEDKINKIISEIKEDEINKIISKIEEINLSFAADDDNEFQDIKDDFQKYWDSNPIYLCDLSWNANEYIKNNWEKRIDRWKDASLESEHAAFLLAECSWLRVSTIHSINYIEARELYQFAYEKGLPEAGIRKSEILFWGFGLSHKNKSLAMKIVQPLTTTKYASMISTIFVEQPIVSEKCTEIYKMFVETLYHEGINQKGVEIGILICRHNLSYNINETLLQGIEKPKSKRTDANGSTICVWQVIKYPFDLGFTIYFNKNGEADDIYIRGLKITK
jgi:hypothetical protein